VGKYAAIRRNTYGKGEVTYVGFMPSDALTENIVEEASNANHEWTDHKDFPITSFK
jgi:beta-galactosidase